MFRFELELDVAAPIKLGITCRARAEFAVIQPGARRKAVAPHELVRMQQLADANNVGAVVGGAAGNPNAGPDDGPDAGMGDDNYVAPEPILN